MNQDVPLGGGKLADALGRLAREAEPDPAHDSATIARARMKFVDALPGRMARRRTRARAFALIGVAAVAVCVSIIVTRGQFFRTPTPPVISYSVGSAPGNVGTRYSAPTTAPLPLYFSEGTSIVLSQGAEVRVVSTSERGAAVALERGRLHAKVQHLTDARWAFVAGPYRVRVTGTEFDMQWDPTTASFEIVLSAGSVRVTGCGLADVLVPAGQTLQNRCAAAHADGPHAAAGEREPAMHAPEPSPSSESSAALEPPLPKTARRGHERAGTVNRPGAAASSDEDDCAAWSTADFGASLDTANASELWQRAQCARRFGSADLIERLLGSLRRRFPGDPRSTTAAFLLGKLAVSQGDLGKAAALFTAYRSEAPSGALTREATGRLMEAWQGLGDSAAARRVASEYLSRYPNGPHEPLARRLLAR